MVSRRHRERLRSAYRRYQEQGLNVLPLCPPPQSGHDRLRHQHVCGCKTPGKRPLGKSWQRYQTQRATPADFKRLLTEDHAEGLVPNLGVVMGPTSGLVSLDADGPAAVEWCHVHLGEKTLRTASFSTGRGVRWLYRLADGRPAPASRVLTPGVELLSAGRQTVMPPSLHVSGVSYAWIASDARRWPQSLLEAPDAFYVGEKRFCAGTSTNLTRGMETDGVPLAEGGRNSRLFSMARALHWRGAGLREVHACLQSLNAGLCRPLLKDSELRRIAQSACSYRRSPTA